MITASLDRELAEQRLVSAIGLVEGLFYADWPYPDASDALSQLQSGFTSALDDLRALDADAGPDVVSRHCLQARTIIYEYLGYIGFIVRSADVRNSFEIYSPIKRIGEALLGDIHIILGSEWNYSPYVYPLPTSKLTDYILVGLPASEAQNALLVPVAGHELGHTIWRRTPLGRSIAPKVRQAIIGLFREQWAKLSENFAKGTNPEALADDLIAMPVWSVPYGHALRQCEEVFCDFIGLWLFGESFLHSFRYLLSPDTPIRTSKNYPTNRARAEFLVTACNALGVDIPPGFVDSFSAPEQSKDSMLAVADEVTTSLVRELINSAAAHCSASGLKQPTKEMTDEVLGSLRSISPSPGQAGIAEILNAAWKIRLNINEWNVPGVASNRKFVILNDLVLKSFEVMEWQIKTSANLEAVVK